MLSRIHAHSHIGDFCSDSYVIVLQGSTHWQSRDTPNRTYNGARTICESEPVLSTSYFVHAVGGIVVVYNSSSICMPRVYCVTWP